MLLLQVSNKRFWNEDFDTEYIVEKPIPDNKKESHQLLTPEKTTLVESEDLDIDELPVKKLKKKVAELQWKDTSKFAKANRCTLEAKVLLYIPENANPFLIFEGITNLNELVKRICGQTNIYATQNGREFATNREEIRAFLDINYIMSISKLPNVKWYCRVNSHLSNDGLRNAMTRNRFMNLLQSLHFTDNQPADKSDKAYKLHIFINHLNKAF